MAPSNAETQRRTFFQAFSGKGSLPLEYGSPLYVPRLSADAIHDPILQVRKRISYAESESVQLLTGFRGNGKSTELRRLKALLEGEGCRVFLIDMADFLNPTKPVEITDFLLSVTAALAAALGDNAAVAREGFWARLSNFLGSEVQIEDLKLGVSGEAGSVELGLRLKTDLTFKQVLQEKLRGHVTRLIEQSHDFVREVVQSLREEAKNPDLKVVLLVDSVEQLRGIGADASAVHRSVEETFSGQPDALKFPTIHVVYTIPPFLLALAQNTGRLLGGSPVSWWPNVHTRKRDGESDAAGLDVMFDILRRRSGAWTTWFDRAQVDRLAEATGGDVRDYFRLLRECVVALPDGPTARVTGDIVQRVIAKLSEDMRFIAADDAGWLLRVHQTHETGLASTEDLPRLARFFDLNLIMNYMNGEPWYDVHPLLVARIRDLTETIQSAP